MPAFVVACLVSAAMLFSPTTPGDGPFAGSDKVVHFLIFATLAALGRRARLPLPALAVGLVGYAIGSEFLQGLTPSRMASPTDALADACGIVAGLALAPLVGRLRVRS